MKWTDKGHQFDVLGNHLKERKELYIYGAGENGKKLYENLIFLNCVKGFIDQEADKQKTGYMRERVISIDAALQEFDKEHAMIVIAVSKIHMTSVIRKLITCGLIEGVHFIWWETFLDVYLPVYANYTHNKLYHKGFSLVPTRKCVFNCKECLNFIPYKKNPDEDNIELVKHELDVFFACFDFVQWISIAGGELLLYSHTKELFQYIGENYRDKIGLLTITTSAALLPDIEALEIFKKYNVTIHISDYRSAIPGLEKKYDEFVKLLEQYDVTYEQFEDHEWIKLDVFRKDELCKTEQEAINHYDVCAIPWQYYTNGKLYSCNWAGFAVMCDAKPDIPSDYYDLHSCTTEVVENGNTRYIFDEAKRAELMEFGCGYSEKGYVEMCKKCNGYITINHHTCPPAQQIPRNSDCK